MEHNRSALDAGGATSRGRGGSFSTTGSRSSLATATRATTRACARAALATTALAAEEATALVAAVALATARVTRALARALVGMATAAAIEQALLSTAGVARATTTITANGGLLAGHEGQANDREENRDPEYNSSIHPRILQISYRYRKRAQYSLMPSKNSPFDCDGRPPKEHLKTFTLD